MISTFPLMQAPLSSNNFVMVSCISFSCIATKKNLGKGSPNEAYFIPDLRLHLLASPISILRRREAMHMYSTKRSREMSDWRQYLSDASLVCMVSWILARRGWVVWMLLYLIWRCLVVRKKWRLTFVIFKVKVLQAICNWIMFVEDCRIFGVVLKYDDFGNWEGELWGRFIWQVRQMGLWSNKLWLHKWKRWPMEWTHQPWWLNRSCPTGLFEGPINGSLTSESWSIYTM